MKEKEKAVGQKPQREAAIRKQAEEALQEERNKLQAIIDAIEHGLTIIDRDYNIVYQSEPSRMTGGYHLGEKCYRAYEGNDKVCDGCPVEKAFRDGKYHTSERRIITPSGEVNVLENTANPVRDTRGRITSCIEVTRNVTERKQAEETLRESEERYRAVIEGAHDMIQSIAPDGHIVFVNQAWLDTLGYTSAELPSLNLFQVIHPDSRAYCQGMFARVMSGESVYGIQASFLTKDGRKVLVEGNATPRIVGGKVVATQGIFRDITERKLAGDALRQSREELRKMFESVTDGILVVDLDGVITETNQSAVAMHGFGSRGELLGKNALELVAPRDREKVAANMRKALKQGAARGMEYTLLRADGTEFPGELGTSVLRDASGKWGGHITIVRDITARKQTEEELRLRAQILDSATDSIFLNDLDGNFIYVNEATCRTHGYSREEFLKMKVPQIVAPERTPSFTSEKQELLEKGRLVVESIHLRKDGSTVPVEVHARTIEMGGGKLCLTVVRDITERKRAEEALQTEKDKLQSLINAMHYGITILDSDYNIVYQNELFQRVSGNQVGEKCYRAYERRDKVCDDCPVEKTFRDGKSHTAERRVITPSGEVTFWEHTANPIKDAEGRITSCLEVTRNITERKEIEEALRDSEQRYRTLFESTLDGAIVIDAETMKVVLANKAAASIFGFDSADDAKGVSPLDFVSPIDRDRVTRLIAEDMFVKDLRQANEFRAVSRDGKEIWVRAVGVRTEYQGRLAGLVSFSDITERKRAEEELRLRAQILDGATDAIFVHDLDGNFIYVNEAACWTHGYSREEFLKMKLPQIVAPERARRLDSDKHELLDKGYIVSESVHLRKDGSMVPMEVHARTVEMGGGKLFLIVAHDITERKKAEEALRRQQAYFQQLFDNSPDAIALLDIDDRFVSNNKGFETLFGYKAEEVKGKTALDFIVPQDRTGEFEALSQAILAGKPVRKETVRKRKDGSLVNIAILGYPILFENKVVGRYILYTDITERKKAEEAEKRMQQELYLSRRLAAIGELAAGVAHEINNPLTGVIGFSQRLLRKSTSEAVSRDLEIIRDEAQRAANIVQNLLTFARRRQSKKEYSNINDIVQKALELRGYALQTDNIEVVTNLAPSLPKIMVDFPQIQEVFLNIILNAEQAMNEAHGRGKLTIKTRQIKDYVQISFADDGPGIPPDKLDKVFDPFFTTREGKGGTGLGLSICHGIVTGHGGKIYARSTPGERGITFFVELPLAPAEAPVGR